jgi:DNA repair protein RecN (Recombination protein N)
MLLQLTISNYALIDRLEIAFTPGLTIITGETGAGKSILLDALSLLTGERADTRVLQDNQRKCVVEASFDTAGDWYSHFFQAHDIDAAEVSIVRREINPSGGSRAFVNDTPVTLMVMKQLGEQLIDIHSQHQTLYVTEHTFRLKVTDSYAGTTKDSAAFARNFALLQQLRSNRETLQKEFEDLAREKDYNQFLYEELQRLQPKEEEQESLEEEQNLLEHAGQTSGLLFASARLLLDAEPGAVPLLNEAHLKLQQAAKNDPSVQALTERIRQLLIEAKDLGMECENLSEKITADPRRLEAVNERLGDIYRLQKKHRVDSTAALAEILEALGKKLDTLESSDASLALLDKEIATLEKTLLDKGKQLHEKRKAASSSLQSEVMECLKDLGMEKARFEVAVAHTGNFFSHGMDEISFRFSANTGGTLQDISRVASGGELSRLMLAIKKILARKSQLPTLVLDEIDTGISGEIAARMGSMMEEMAGHTQLLAITHLPQIASKGKSHYKVCKTEKNGRTNSEVVLLDATQRVDEIAGMLSAGKPGEAARKNALELLSLKQ